MRLADHSNAALVQIPQVLLSRRRRPRWAEACRHCRRRCEVCGGRKYFGGEWLRVTSCQFVLLCDADVQPTVRSSVLLMMVLVSHLRRVLLQQVGTVPSRTMMATSYSRGSAAEPRHTACCTQCRPRLQTWDCRCGQARCSWPILWHQSRTYANVIVNPVL